MYSIITHEGKGATMPEKTTGFASPAQGYEEEGIDLNRLLIRNPPATIYARLGSSDMEYLGLVKGTLLVVDRSITPSQCSCYATFVLHLCLEFGFLFFFKVIGA